MPQIRDVRLEITENAGAASALVTYELLPSPHDLELQLRYIVLVHLVGVDEGAGEDGHSENIRDGFAAELVRFPLADLKRRHLIALPASRLNEDGSDNPIAVDFLEDEIVARVELKPADDKLIGFSNVVRRGGAIFAKKLVPA